MQRKLRSDRKEQALNLSAGDCWAEMQHIVASTHTNKLNVLQKDAQQESVLQTASKPTVHTHDFSQSDSLQKRIDRIKLLKYQELNRVGELTKKQLNRTMQRLSKQREASFQDNFDKLQRGLTSQDGIIAQVNDLLKQSASVKHQKKVQLFDEWDQQVCLCILQLTN